MSIAIRKPTINPDKFTKGQPKSATLSFLGVIDLDNLNPVQMDIETEEESPVFLIDENGDEVKKISWEEEFSTMEKEFEHEIEVVIKQSQFSLTPEKVKLTATAKNGKKSTRCTSIFYK